MRCCRAQRATSLKRAPQDSKPSGGVAIDRHGRNNSRITTNAAHCQRPMIVSRLSSIAFAARVAPSCLRQLSQVPCALARIDATCTATLPAGRSTKPIRRYRMDDSAILAHRRCANPACRHTVPPCCRDSTARAAARLVRTFHRGGSFSYGSPHEKSTGGRRRTLVG